MEISHNITDVDSTGLSRQEKLRLQRAVKDFESIFVSHMLKSMRASMSSTEMFGDSFGGDIMEGMFDLEFARHMSANNSFGLAEILYKQITGEEMPHEQRKLPRTVPVQQPQQKNLPQTVPFPVQVNQGSTLHERLARYEPYINEAAKKFGLDTSLIKAVIAAESAARADAQSNKNAKGLMQLIDSTAAEVGVRNVWDPRENILGGTEYLHRMLRRHSNDVTLALASYNAGPGAVDRFKGVPPYRETQTYIERVLNYQRYFSEQEP